MDDEDMLFVEYDEILDILNFRFLRFRLRKQNVLNVLHEIEEELMLRKLIFETQNDGEISLF